MKIYSYLASWLVLGLFCEMARSEENFSELERKEVKRWSSTEEQESSAMNTRAEEISKYIPDEHVGRSSNGGTKSRSTLPENENLKDQIRSELPNDNSEDTLSEANEPADVKKVTSDRRRKLIYPLKFNKKLDAFGLASTPIHLGDSAKTLDEKETDMPLSDNQNSKYEEANNKSMLHTTPTYLFEGELNRVYNFSIGALIIDYLTHENLERRVVLEDCTAKLINKNDVLYTIVNFSPDSMVENLELCSEMKEAPVVDTFCGSVFLLPGYRFRLVPNEWNCTWHFRPAVPSVMLNFAVGGMEGQIRFHVKEQFLFYRALRNSGVQFSQKEFSLTLKNGTVDDLTGELCIPARYNIFHHYKLFGAYDETPLGPNPACGQKHTLNSKRSRDFYNETTDPVPFGTFPWQGLLIIQRNSSDYSRLPVMCSAALVADGWLVTMASCFSSVWEVTSKSYKGSTFPYVAVHFGMSGLLDMVMSERYVADEVVLYPAMSTSHDIALVRLSTGPARLDPVCLPPFEKSGLNEDLVDVSGQVIGWTVKRDSRLPQDLYVSEEAVVATQECGASRSEYLPHHTLCTMNSTEQDRCLVDSLLYDTKNGKHVLRGLAFNRGGCDGSGLNVFTSVAHFVPWINAVVAGKKTPMTDFGPEDVSDDGLESAADDGLGSAADDGLGSAADDGLGSAADDGLGSAADDGLGSAADDGLGSGADDGLGSGADDGLGSGADDGLGSAADDGLGSAEAAE